MDFVKQIHEKYGFNLPDAYLRMLDSGWFDASSPAYLWIHEAEWMHPDEILSHKPASYHKPGFIPFAFTGGEDHWCWWPSSHPQAVVLCPHDCLEGEFDSPTFTGFIYRRMLSYAFGGFFPEEEQEARENLLRWAKRLAPYFPLEWTLTLEMLATAKFTTWSRGKMRGDGFLTVDEYDAIVQRDLAFVHLNSRFEWMYR